MIIRASTISSTKWETHRCCCCCCCFSCSVPSADSCGAGALFTLTSRIVLCVEMVQLTVELQILPLKSWVVLVLKNAAIWCSSSVLEVFSSPYMQIVIALCLLSSAIWFTCIMKPNLVLSFWGNSWTLCVASGNVILTDSPSVIFNEVSTLPNNHRKHHAVMATPFSCCGSYEM